MGEKRPYGLLPWILVPLALFALLLLIALQLPSSDCGGEDVSGSPGEILFIGIVALSIIGTVGAGLLQIADMAREDRLGTGDLLTFAVALLIVGIVAATVADGRNGSDESLAVAGLVVAPVALLGLVIAAFAGRGKGSVGALLPIYLFGAAWWYYLIGALAIAAIDGAFC